MVKCAVLFCKTYSDRSTNISFHLFPSDLSMRRKWVEAVQREKQWIPTKHHRICSRHFEPECYEEHKKLRKLHKDAIPTLNLPEFERKQCCSQVAVTVENEEDSHDSNDSEDDNNKLIVAMPFQNPQDVDANNKLIVNPLIPSCDPQSITDSPKTKRLKQKIREKDWKIKRLQYHNRRLRKKMEGMQEILDHLTVKKVITDEGKITLEIIE